MTNNSLILIIIALVPVLTLSVFLSSSCHPRGTELYFETIEQRQAAGTGEVYESKEPGLIIIARSQEQAQVHVLVTPDAQVLLQEVDSEEYFLVAVFQGWKPSDSYGAEVRRITQRDDVITLYAHFTERDPERLAADMATSPYHVVKVRKPDPTGKEIGFLLDVGGRVVSSRKHFIPWALHRDLVVLPAWLMLLDC